MTQPLKFKKLRPTAILPTKGTSSSAGYDLYLAKDVKFTTYESDARMLYFGISVEIPEGYCGLLLERSSTHKVGLTQANKVGVIDSDYRGELMAPYYFTDDEHLCDEHETDAPYNSLWGKKYKVGERIAQLVIVPIFQADPIFVDELSSTERGAGSFGSTGN